MNLMLFGLLPAQILAIQTLCGQKMASLSTTQTDTVDTLESSDCYQSRRAQKIFHTHRGGTYAFSTTVFADFGRDN